jgi:hypothetical protein
MEIDVTSAKQSEDIKPLLFIVWIDDNFGYELPNWEWNSPPKPIEGALEEAQECRATGYPTQIWPEGQTPRPDGRNYPDHGF